MQFSAVQCSAVKYSAVQCGVFDTSGWMSDYDGG